MILRNKSLLAVTMSGCVVFGVGVTACGAATEDDAESAAGALTGEVTIFGTGDVPQTASDPDTGSVELGLRFRADVAGTVNGVRFLKGSGNGGTHVGHLWSNTGALLATVTFGSETASGWQTARFSTPVTVKPNVTYVASYHTNVGHYAATNNAFAAAGLDRGHLHALKDNQNGRNGIYHYGTSAFPASTFQASNYFVDVVFQPSSTTPPPPPADAGTPPPPPPPPPADGGSPPPAGTCDLTATTSTFAAQFAAAKTGQAICLAAGDYGTWRGSAKSGLVTVRPQAGAVVKMSLDFNGASNIRVEGMTMGSVRLVNTTHDISVAKSKFVGQVVIDGVANANILFDGNSHVGIDTCEGCFAAMLQLPYGSNTFSGVTVQNSLFADGNADGIQAGTGLNILDNEFRNIHENGPNDPAHTDPIQLLGAKGAVVRGNWIHDCSDGIVAYDGIDHATIEDNVLDIISGRYGIELYSDNGSIIRHNTLRYATTCAFLPCGQIMLDHKSADPAGKGTIIVDNVATAISISNGSTAAQIAGNMLPTADGAGTFAGKPTYVGGAAPTSYAGYRLAAGSPGKGAATTGGDVGIH